MNELIARVGQYGVPFVFANIFLEQLGLPIPAYPALVVAGALAFQGTLSFPALAVAILVAALTADSAWFLLGRKHGAFMLKLVCRVSLSPDTCVRETEARFEKWGVQSLLFAKFIPGFSMVAPPLAGSLGTPYARFALYDAAGTALWAGLALGIGAVFHTAVGKVLGSLQALGSRAFLVLLAALALFILGKWAQRRRFYRFLRMARISVTELREMIESGSAPRVFDVRGTSRRGVDPRRIPGALVLEIPDLDRQLTDLPRDGDIILYCT